MMKILKTTKLKKAKVNYTMEMFNSTSIKNNQLELAEDAEVKEEEQEAKCRLRMLRSWSKIQNDLLWKLKEHCF